MPKIIKTNKKLFIVLVLALVLLLLYLAIPQTQADTISSRKITLSNSTPSQTDVIYDFEGNHSTDNVKCLEIAFCTTSSGDCTGPTGFTAANATRYDTGWAGWTAANWTIAAIATRVRYTYATGQTGSDNYSFATASITNPSSEDTYYARVATYSDDSCSTQVDTGTTAFAIVHGISVSASVPETLSFSIGDVLNDDCDTRFGNLAGPDFAATYVSSGATWTQAVSNAQWGARFFHSSPVYNSQLWIIGGAYTSISYTNDVWWSSDGTTWTKSTSNAQWSARNGHLSPVYDGKVWVMGGYQFLASLNDVWSSSDGITWTKSTSNAQWGVRDATLGLVFNDRMWVIGGGTSYYNDSWWSTDGVSWTKATSNAQWLGRSTHTGVVFDGKMWVIAGYTGGTPSRLNDVWYSEDGTTWTKTTSNAQFPARSRHASVVYDNKIWVMGGSDLSSDYSNDVWYSSDGASWTKAIQNSQWLRRYAHTSLVYNAPSGSGQTIWVIGGYTGSSRNDVWYSSLDTISGRSIDFGELSPSTFYHACTDLVVTTNSGTGYSVTNQETSSLYDSSLQKTIDDSLGDSGSMSETTSSLWSNVGNTGFGYSCANISGSDCYLTSTSYYFQFSCQGLSGQEALTCNPDSGNETSQTIMLSSSPVNNNQCRIQYKLSVSDTQAAGSYSNTVIYIVTPLY